MKSIDLLDLAFIKELIEKELERYDSKGINGYLEDEDYIKLEGQKEIIQDIRRSK